MQHGPASEHQESSIGIAVVQRVQGLGAPVWIADNSAQFVYGRDSGSSAHATADLAKQLEVITLGANYVVSNDDIELSGAAVAINDAAP